MNSSGAIELDVETEPIDALISRWAKIKKALMDSRRNILKENLTSEAEFRRMEITIAEQLREEQRQIAEGLVYTTPHTIFIHQNSQPAGEVRRIHLKTKE
jgi:hypothetical protein